MVRYILLIGILSFQIVAAQKTYKTESRKAISLYAEGLAYYKIKEYTGAEEKLKSAIRIDVKFQDAYLVLAEVYWEQGKYENAIEQYNKGLLIDPYYYPRGYLNKGKLEVKIARYEEARNSYLKYFEMDTIESKYTERAKRGLEQTEFAIHAMNNPVDFEPVSLGPNVNTAEDEYWPSLSADEKTLIITRLVHVYDIVKEGKVQEDFFISEYGPEGWEPMKDAGFPLNTDDNEGAQSISANGQLMVYTVCNRKGVIGRCDIYYSTREGMEWTFPKNMGEPVNSVAKETQPSLSADGRIIYFASNRPGGKGGLDIWMSSRDSDDNWQSPVNLGNSINTPGDEMSPFIHHDNSSLYFSSNYHIGMGDFDLFVSRLDSNGNWSKPRNLGYPINTNRDEIGLIVNARGNTAYYASDIHPATGKDIYRFTLHEDARPDEVSYMKGRVFDEKTRERLRARFELYDLKNGKLINQSYSDPVTGEFLLCIPTNKNYMLNVEHRGYLFHSENFALKGIYHLEKPFMKDVPLKPIQLGEKSVLKNVFFETDSYSLKPESKYELDKIIHFLKFNSEIMIEISGHTDNIGTREYNLTLSEKRAKSVVDYLVNHGISEDRLQYKGYGFDQPVDENETEEGRANNRRTEFKIIKTNQ